MPKRIGVSLLLLVLWISCAFAEGIDDEYVKPGSSKWGDVLDRVLGQKGFGKSYALVVGVGDYNHYTKLSAPARDAEQVRNFLRDEAQFDRVITLTDEKATRTRIESLMDRILPQLVQSNDRFLFYFSGHGMTRDLGTLKRGYLILKTSQKGAWDEMIDMPRMRDWAQNFGNARHVLFLLDACFSGLAASERKVGFDPRDQTIQRLMQPASHIITAGIEGEESFIFNEKSLFTAAFLAAARGALSMPTDGVISLSEMMVQINRALDAKRAELNEKFKMTPRTYSSRIENNAGEFFFLPKSIPRSNNPAPSVSAALERKSDIPPASVQAYVSRGVEYGEKNDLDRAIAEFSEAIRLDPKHTLAFYNRGKAYLLKKDYGRAIADYNEAIRLDPSYATAFYGRGIVYREMNDSDRAIVDYNEAIRLDPKYAAAFTNRGNAYADKKDYDRAIADYNTAIRLGSKDAEAKRKAAEDEQQRLAAVKAEEERKARVAAEAQARAKAEQAEKERVAAAKAEEERNAKAAARAAEQRLAAQTADPTAKPSTSIAGNWSGQINQVGSQAPYKFELVIGARGGETTYPDLDCTGKLTRVGASDSHVFFVETITKGQAENGGRCPDGAITATRLGNRLDLFWFGSIQGSTVVAYGSLSKK